MNKVLKNENMLLQELSTRKVLTLQDAMSILKVSESTARRLFVNLEKKGMCVRNNGNIRMLENDLTNIYVYESLEKTNILEKDVIANKAITLLKSNDIIFLDSGTTLAKFSAKIAEALKNKRLTNLTIYTNSFMNFTILKDCAKIILLGGEYRENRKDFCGMIPEIIIREICINKSFIGADGYKKNAGFTAIDLETVRLQRAIIESSEENYILADEKKFKRACGMCFAREKNIARIITNDKRSIEKIIMDKDKIL